MIAKQGHSKAANQERGNRRHWTSTYTLALTLNSYRENWQNEVVFGEGGGGGGYKY